MEAKQGSGETHSRACQGLVAPAAPAGASSHCPHHASPMDAPVSPGDAHTAPWTQLRVLAPSWCQGAPGVMSGHPGTATDLWHCLQGMVGWKSRSCSRFPRWKKPHSLQEKELQISAALVHSHFVEFPVLLSCLLSKGRGAQARESGANRVHMRCPAVGAHRIWADITPCHGTPVWGHFGNVHTATGAVAGAATSSLHPPLSNKRKLFSTPQFLGEIYGPSGSRGPGLLSVSACRASSRHTASFMRHMQLCRSGVSLQSPPLVQHPQPTRLFLPSGSCGNAAAVNCSLSDAGAASLCHANDPAVPSSPSPGGTASVQGGARLMGQKCPAAVPVPVLLTHGVVSESVAFPLPGWRLST